MKKNSDNGGKKKKKYEPPVIATEKLYEMEALACNKCGAGMQKVQGFQCRVGVGGTS